MKTNREIVTLRKRLLEAAASFGLRHELPFSGTVFTAEQCHHMALGAIAFADNILELERPANLENLIAILTAATENETTP